MPKFTIEVAETVIYRGVIDADTEEQARETALEDVVDHGGDTPGSMSFFAVTERESYAR